MADVRAAGRFDGGPLRAVLPTVPSPHDEDRFGALNLYGERPAAFDDTSIELGEVLAALCSATLAAAIEVEGLRSALASRDVIGQAKGILMQRHRIPASEAFDLLAKTSQSRNVKVREIAQQVVETGELG